MNLGHCDLPFDLMFLFTDCLQALKGRRNFFLGQDHDSVPVTDDKINGSNDSPADADFQAYGAGPVFLGRVGRQTAGKQWMENQT